MVIRPQWDNADPTKNQLPALIVSQRSEQHTGSMCQTREREMGGMSESERFVTLMQPHLPAMLRAATAVLGAQDAEDAAQEAIVRAWQSWSMLRDEQALRSWLLRITVNVCREWHRGRYGQFQRHTTALPEDADELKAVLALPPGSNDHANALDLRQAINDLQPDLRLLVVLRYYGGLDSTELGTALNLPPGTVRTRLRRALKLLRTNLHASSDASNASSVS